MGGSGPTLPHNELPFGTQKELQTEGVAKKQLPLICSTWMTKELSIPATPKHWLRHLIKITPGTTSHTPPPPPYQGPSSKKTLSSRYEVPGAMLNAENINMSQVSPRSFEKKPFLTKICQNIFTFSDRARLPTVTWWSPRPQYLLCCQVFFSSGILWQGSSLFCIL